MMDDGSPLTPADYRELATFLEAQLKRCQTRGETQQLGLRLARLYFSTLQEPGRAYEVIEPMVAEDPGDDALRLLYMQVADEQGKQLAAAETLGRALERCVANDVRQRVAFDVATLYLQEGELRQARAAFLEVILVDGTGQLALAAARRLRHLEGDPGDSRVMGAALEVIATSPDRAERHDAGTRLLSLHQSKPLPESQLVVAFQSLVDSPRASDALEWLRLFYARNGDKSALSNLYKRLALRAADPLDARSLVFQSIEVASDDSDEGRIQQWLSFVEKFGPDRRAYAELVPMFERAQRWEDLCRVLEGEAELAPLEEGASLWARIGQTRLDRLGDVGGALTAFNRCLALDPANERALSAVEDLMSAGDFRLAAAEVLEPVYASAGEYEGAIRVLVTRGELHPDPTLGLDAFAAAVDIACGQLADFPRAMDLSARALVQALAFVSGAVLDWVDRLEQLARRAKQPDAHATILLGVLGVDPIDSFERVAVAISAIEALRATHAPDRALALCRRAVETDPSSPELLRRLDELLGADERPDERLARYEGALELASVPGRRSSLRHTIAAIRRDLLGDLAGAAEMWRAILSEEPSDFAAYGALIDATSALGDVDGALDVLDVARMSLKGNERNQMTVRKARALAGSGSSKPALDLCREILDENDCLTPSVLQDIAEIARAEKDAALYRRVLELVASCGEPAAKKLALERLGDFLLDDLCDRAAAAEAWKAAAQMCGDSPVEQEHARLLYERTLEAHPADAQAAEQLVEHYARAGDWAKMPGALRVVIRADEDPGRCVLLVLRLEASAVQAGALEAFVSLVDDLVVRLGRDSPEQIRALTRARARALGTDPARRGAAAEAYRELIERFGGDEDVRDFGLLLDSMPACKERHQERRWLYQWRSAQNPRSANLLIDWAKAEEDHGAADEAIAVYRRLAELDSGRNVAQEALCRLKLHGGDVVGGLAALRALRASSSELEQNALDLRIAQLLADDLARPVEAAEVLALTLAVRPQVEQAHDLARRLLGDPTSSEQVLDRIEQIASETDDLSALRILDFLVAGDADSVPPGPRRRFYERIAELAHSDPALALPALVRGATELPEAISLWDASEKCVREVGQPEVLAGAYQRALLTRVVDPVFAEILGRRMVRFEEERAIESSGSIDALLHVLSLSPGARWALDRVKLALGSQGRYAELFALFDRAIDAVDDVVDRRELLYEAAFAARDLARLPQRAIAYLEAIRALRGDDDDTVEGALERLYERQGQTVELVAMLEGRLGRMSGFKLRDLRRRIASLWLDLGDAERAGALLERMLEGDASVADAVDLLERIVQQPPRDPSGEPAREGTLARERAIQLLRGHYESLGRIDDVVRMAERSLELAIDPEPRGRCIRDLVRLRLLAADRNSEPFARVIPRVEVDAAGDPSLAKIAYRTLLGRAIQAMKRRSPSSIEVSSSPSEQRPDRMDAEDGAWRAVQALNELLLNAGGASAAVGLLHRSSHLPFARPRRRELLRAAALASSDRAQNSALAIRIFEELFDDDSRDEAAEKSLVRFTELLDAAGDHAKLAKLWEAQANVRAMVGDSAEERACWERAARHWERNEAWEQAIEAHRRGAALGSEASFQALATIHVGRDEWAEAAKAFEWLYAHALPDQRSLRALRLAEAYIKLDERPRARSCLEHALGHTVADGEPLPEPAEHTEQVRDRLIALYREDEVWKPLAHLLSAEATRVEHPDRKLALLREAADRFRWNLNEPAEAATLLERALTMDPQDPALRASLVEVLESLQRWDQAAAALRGQIDLWGEQRSRERALVHRSLARQLVRANRQLEALAELRLAVEMHPGHPGSLYDLARIALDLGQLDLAEKMYRSLLFAVRRRNEDAAEDSPRRADVFLDLSEIASRKGDTTRAEDLFDSAFDEALGHGDDPGRLERALRGRGRHDLLSRALERRVERGATLTDRAVALGSLAELSANPGPSQELAERIRKYAERIARDLKREDFTDASAWTALSTVYLRFGDGLGEGELAPLLEAAIPRVRPGADRSRLRVVLAKILLEDPSRADSALAVLASAVAEDPLGRETVDLYSKALERHGRLGELVPVLERRLASVSSLGGSNDSVDAAWRLAQALEGAGRAHEAVAIYESILDMEPTDVESMRALSGRLEHFGSKRIADCFERWIAVDARMTHALTTRLVSLRDDQGDVEGAARALERGFEANPAASALRDRLVDIYEKRERWADAARILIRAIEVTPNDRPLLRRLLDACERAGDDAAALRVLDLGIAAQPRDAELLSMRSTARERVGEEEGAVSDLESANLVEGRYLNALLGLLARLGNRTDSPRADAHLLCMTDTLLRVSRPKQARRELERLLARSPNHLEGLEKIAQLAAAEGNLDEAAEAYRKLLIATEKGGGREALVRVAAATADACNLAGGLGEAREVLERVVSVLSRDPDDTVHLEQLLQAMRDWKRLAKLLVGKADDEERPDVKTELLTRAGQHLLEEPSDPERALVVIERVRAMSPQNIDALLLWSKAHVALGRPHHALPVLHDAAERNRGKRSPLLANIYLEMGRAHLAADEVVEAFSVLELGFGVDRRAGDIAMLLGLVALDLDDEKTAERAFSAVTAMPPRKDGTGPGADAASKAVAFYHLASLAEAKGDLPKARSLATKAVGGDPRLVAARLLLEKLESRGVAAGARAK